MYDFITDLDEYFCEKYASYDKLTVIPGYKMPVMQATETRADGRRYSYTLPADTMRLANQEKKAEILAQLKEKMAQKAVDQKPVGLNWLKPNKTQVKMKMKIKM